jgi:Toxin SymE, type I toxin-antitoxin system
MSQSMKPRRSTVYSTYPAPRTLPYAVAEGSPIPALRLRGRWLAQAGFGIGSRVEVLVTDGELVLKVLPSSALPDVKRSSKRGP